MNSFSNLINVDVWKTNDSIQMKSKRTLTKNALCFWKLLTIGKEVSSDIDHWKNLNENQWWNPTNFFRYDLHFLVGIMTFFAIWNPIDISVSLVVRDPRTELNGCLSFLHLISSGCDQTTQKWSVCFNDCSSSKWINLQSKSIDVKK